MMKNMITIILITLFCSLILGLSLRGINGTPTSQQLNTAQWKDDGPFELSPERGRYALLYSVLEDHSFQFSDEIGQFARPDVAASNGRYVSLFAPGVSFAVIPGYLIGRYFNLAQVGAFAVIALFGLINLLLIRAISIKLGANKFAATLGGLTYLFATPSFAYSVELYQHQLSTFLILVSVYSLMRFKTIVALLVTFFAFALAVPIDNPNLIFLAPIAIIASKKFIDITQTEKLINLKLYLTRILTIFIMVIPISFFLWSNYMSYGNPLQLAGTLPTATADLVKPKEIISVTNLEAQQVITANPEVKKEKSAVGFFKTRHLLNGFYIHFLSPDRGMLYFTPVMFFGLIGLILAYRRKVKFLSVLVAIFGSNVLLYSLWGDPYGGWAFGSRYLIPSYAILAIFISLLLSFWKKSSLLLIAFFVTFSFSVGVNTLGAITSSANPPQVQAEALSKLSGMEQKYSFDRNFDFLQRSGSKSFVYQNVFKNYLTTLQYYQILVGLIILGSLGVLLALRFVKEAKNV